MQDIIRQWHQLSYPLNIPCNETQLEGLKRVLQDPLEESSEDKLIFRDLYTLYRDHNGIPISAESWQLPLRLMSYEEMLQTNIVLRNLQWLETDQCVLWSDDNSNYAGVYLHQPLRGRVFFWDHEDFDFAPRFYNVRNFYQALLKLIGWNSVADEENQQDWVDLETDYPNLIPSEHDKDDLVVAEFHHQRYENENDHKKRRNLAYIAMNLLPIHIYKPLYNFLEDKQDMYIQARAIDILGLRRDTHAIPKIEQIILTVPSNPRSAGLRALGKMGETALPSLLRLMQHLPTLGQGYELYFVWALQEIGYEAHYTNGLFRYRKSSQDDWTMVHPKP